jgi:hypothetical protein
MQQIQITKTVYKSLAPFFWSIWYHNISWTFVKEKTFGCIEKKHQRIQLNTALTHSREYGHEYKFYKLQDLVLRHPISVKGRVLQRDNVPIRRGRGKKKTVKVL